jgi:hypothetical protein
MEHPPVKGLMEVAMPVMHRLAARILQPCHLAIPSEELIVVVARVESPGDVGFVVRVGHRRPFAQRRGAQGELSKAVEQLRQAAARISRELE